ncbi:hypothetical protein LEP1GSC133_2554 [Leptospira borgpetersenii serovar Pomona str. 200901868]|uniref:Uncharacterized protein n=1 Tax=Leptospira borgpetersenii serovar Pomona str. 200901868 TaxID=1192866 RepID=M6WH71_LEPBO|nr:hypothetical protein LEP1GSC133_2554 [Leptospira borgpetersenii serovar Pomona str. 200901868]
MRSRSKLEPVSESRPSAAVVGQKRLSFFSVRNSVSNRDILPLLIDLPGKPGGLFFLWEIPQLRSGPVPSEVVVVPTS